jgi:hypothetical protein
MTRTTQQQLESYLWEAAVFLRGKIDAGDYKKFKKLVGILEQEGLLV